MLKKRQLLLIFLIIITFNCNKNNSANETPEVENIQNKEWQIIETKSSQFGKEEPAWISRTKSEIESMDEYRDYYVFIINEEGKDLEGVKRWMKNFSLTRSISDMLSKDVKVEETNGTTTTVVTTSFNLNASKIKVIDEYWIKYQKIDNPQEIKYKYTMFVVIPKKEIDNMQ